MTRDRQQTADDSRPERSDRSAFQAWTETTSDRFSAAETRRVEVFVRSMLPPLGVKSTQERLIRRLDELVAESYIDDVAVTVTGDRLCLCETCTGTDAGSDLVGRIDDLTDWGTAYDASVGDFFETRKISSDITDDHARALVPPQVAVALRCDDSLAGVFPCRMGESTYTIGDFFDAVDQFVETGPLVLGV